MNSRLKIDHQTRSKLDEISFRMTGHRFSGIFSRKIYAFCIGSEKFSIVTALDDSTWNEEWAIITRPDFVEAPEGFYRIARTFYSGIKHFYVKIGSLFEVSKETAARYRNQYRLIFQHNAFSIVVASYELKYFQKRIRGEFVIFSPSMRLARYQWVEE